jgi:two-component system sensor kinase FixL
MRRRDGVAPQAGRLLRVPVADLPEAIRDALESVGRRLAADRAALWEFRPEERRLLGVQEWGAAGPDPLVAALPADAVPWLVQQLAEGRRVAFRSCSALPREAARERRWFARHGPRSAVLEPLVIGGATAGVLVVGTTRRERSWGPAALATLEEAGAALAAALVRLRAHDASLGSEGRLAGILEAGPDAILLVERSGRIVTANGVASALFLRTRENLCKERLQDVLAGSPEGARRPRRSALDALLASGEPLDLEARRGDGSALPVEVTLREVRTPREELFCCGLRDVSEDRRARDEASRIRDEIALHGRAAMLAEMASGIAHELNQPLTAVLSNAETAQRLLRTGGAGVAPVREALEDVVNETRRAADILGRMREMLRRRPVERVPVDVAQVLASVVRRFREEAVARAIRLSLELDPVLPRVLGDRVQLEQVLMNLVLNAFDALGQGTAPPRTVAVRARAAGGRVDVSVRDSGPGLAGEALARAFDPFFTTKPGGLGMGLPISRSIVEAHGGRLLARSEAGRGATFELDLPAAPAPAGPADERRQA